MEKLRFFVLFVAIFASYSAADLSQICSGVQVGFFPNPNNCRSFIFCVMGTPNVLYCNDQYPVFDPSTFQCVVGNPDTCEIGETTTTSPTITPTPPTIPPQTEVPQTEVPVLPTNPPTLPTLPPTLPTFPPDVTFPTLPPDFTWPTLPTLPPSTTDAPTTTAPVFPTLPTFPPDVTLPTLPPTLPTFPTITPPTVTPETTQTPRPPVNICLNRNRQFIANPSSCYRYFYCLMGIPLAGECEVGRIFHENVNFPRLSGCYVGNRETCERDRDIIIVTNSPRL